MPKKIKLDINDFKLKSFVTSLDELNKVKGGFDTVVCTEELPRCKTGTCTLGPCCF